MGAFFPTNPETQLPEFCTGTSGDIADPTSGKLNIIEPPADQKLYGWYPFRKRPERSVFNWIHRHTYKQLKYWKDVFFPAIDSSMLDHDNRLIAQNVETSVLYNIENQSSFISVQSNVLKVLFKAMVVSGLNKMHATIETDDASSLVGVDLVQISGLLNHSYDGGVIDNSIDYLAFYPNGSTLPIFGYCVTNITPSLKGLIAFTGIWVGNSQANCRSQMATKHSVDPSKIYISKYPIGFINGNNMGGHNSFYNVFSVNNFISYSSDTPCIENVSISPRTLLYGGTGFTTPLLVVPMIVVLEKGKVVPESIKITIEGVKTYVGGSIDLKDNLQISYGANSIFVDMLGVLPGSTFKKTIDLPYNGFTSDIIFAITGNFQKTTPPAGSTIIYTITNIEINSLKYNFI